MSWPKSSVIASSTRSHRDMAWMSAISVMLLRPVDSTWNRRGLGRLSLIRCVSKITLPHTGKTAVMNVSNPLSKSSFATPMPPGCSNGANGFFTTYST
jgi:hypothetical protein